MVKAANHIKGHVMLMSLTDVSVLLYMIGLEKRYWCTMDWGAGPCYVILLEEECPHMIG